MYNIKKQPTAFDTETRKAAQLFIVYNILSKKSILFENFLYLGLIYMKMYAIITWNFRYKLTIWVGVSTSHLKRLSTDVPKRSVIFLGVRHYGNAI